MAIGKVGLDRKTDLSAQFGLMPDETPPPPPAPLPTSPSPIPVVKGYKGMAVTSWILIIFTGLLAIVPLLGYISAFLVWIVAPLVIIFGIVILTRGGTGQGIFLIVLAVLLVPWSFVAPTVSTIAVAASVNQRGLAQEKQIMSNLNTIATAKAQFATDTGAASGSAVTMEDLKKYLGGTGIKPVVGETYDPHAIGEAPSAKLPDNMATATYQAGAVVTATSTASATPATSDSSPSPSASAEEEE